MNLWKCRACGLRIALRADEALLPCPKCQGPPSFKSAFRFLGEFVPKRGGK